ncbi:LAFE_0F03796g1_1 [Lachancea fermentati]|uniref:LAFE_0F03796g1_1 n=1 Tax=Lachancea fermentati TaxID=4955 RepID=A0A1G4MEZ6_LACFM|nr:LAFE_0F03796g1_1 [Lachancea fermentati]
MPVWRTYIYTYTTPPRTEHAARRGAAAARVRRRDAREMPARRGARRAQSPAQRAAGSHAWRAARSPQVRCARVWRPWDHRTGARPCTRARSAPAPTDRSAARPLLRAGSNAGAGADLGCCHRAAPAGTRRDTRNPPRDLTQPRGSRRPGCEPARECRGSACRPRWGL